MNLNNPTGRKVFFWAMIVSAAEAVIAIAFLAKISADPKNSILFGYSLPRLLLMLFLAMNMAVCLLIAFCLRNRPDLFGRVVQRIGLNSRVKNAFLVVLLGLIFLALLLFLSPNFQSGRWALVVDRLEPLVAWGLALSLQIFFCIVLLQDERHLRLKNPWLVGFVWIVFFVFFSIRLFNLINLTKIVDLQTSHSVVSGVDDIEYVTPAVNLVYGYGYVQSIILPLEIYHTGPVGFLVPRGPGQYFISQRPPGTSLLLAGIYGLFGTGTIYPRMVFIILAWVTGLLLLFTGTMLAGWIGAIAGGLAGLYYCVFSQAVDYALGLGVINSEIPSIFWISLFALVFVIFLKKLKVLPLIISAFCLSCFVMTRGNYFPSVFFLFVWMLIFLGKPFRKKSFLFLVLVLLPSIFWSIYIKAFQQVTGYYYQPQAVSAFAITNNLDVLEGVGPAHVNRGDWPPQDGVYLVNGLEPDYWPKPGEDPTLKALKFWWDYRDELPTLFYRKLKVGSWYHDGAPRYPLGRMINGIFIGGVGFLFAALGMRPARRNPGLLPGWSGGKIVILQIAQIILLFVISNYLAFWLVLLLWGSILVFAVFRPYGEAAKLPFNHPSWMVSFIVTYLAATMVFASDCQRYHAQLDPLIMLYSLLGIGLILKAGFARLVIKSHLHFES